MDLLRYLLLLVAVSKYCKEDRACSYVASIGAANPIEQAINNSLHDI
jgi:hypothetical protein